MNLSLLPLLSALLYIGTFAQAQVVDSTARQATQYALTRYEAATSDPERLYNGFEYIGYDRRLTGHPFFASDSTETGSIRSNGQIFTIPLRYDIVYDELVLNHPAGYRMALHSDRINSFLVKGHTFIRMTDSTQQGLPTGFYDLLYNGPTQLVARHTKTILVNPAANGTYGVFNPKTVYFIRKSGRYFPIKNKRTLLAVLDNSKKQLTAFMRKEKLKFKLTIDDSFGKIARYYDELPHTL